MNKANKVKLGAFVLLSAVLLISGFLAVGVTQVFTPKIHAMTVLNTSVEGLSAGSPVKYLGMPVGRVTRIAMRENDGYIAVYFDLLPSALDRLEAGKPLTSSAANLAEILQKRNPSCFINAAGLMGGTYLELTLGGQEPPALPHLKDVPEDVFYIQSRPSHIGNAIQNISRVIEELSKVNLVQLTDKLDQTLDSMNDVFGRGELMTTLKHLNNISRDLELSVQNLRSALSQENIEKINRSIANIESSTTGIRKATSPEEIGALVRNLNAFLTDSRAFLEDARQLGNRLGDEAETARRRLESSLTRLDNTSRRLTGAIDRLEDQPNQLVRGRQDPPLEDAAGDR